MAKQTSHALVIGGSMAGLLTARVLSEHFETVSIVERDRLPTGGGARAGVPQAAHQHVLLLRGLCILERLFPGIRQELVAFGAPLFDMAADIAWLTRAGWGVRFPSDLKVLSCSRDLLEWRVRERLLAQAQVRVVEATDVCGLVREGGAVVGIRTRKRQPQALEREERAQLVVDASGRNSRVPEWIAALGYEPPEERIVDGYLGYASRMYRIPGTESRDWFGSYVQPAPPVDMRGGVILPIEGNRWHLTLAGVGGDYPPTDVAGFNAFARSLRSPVIWEAIRHAEPLTSISGFRATENRWRACESVRAWPDGLILLGDAVCAFNPVYAQGMTTAAMAAETLSKELSRQPRRDGTVVHNGFAARFQRVLARVNAAPWGLATAEDLRVPQTTGARVTAATRLAHAYFDRVMEAATERPDVRLAFLRAMHMLDSPAAMFAPRVMLAALGRVFASVRQQPSPDSSRPNRGAHAAARS
jgi:2-polyprenyl-6-methoxyphenol hydroxylase-like FAD-dependent oxidoreductase